MSKVICGRLLRVASAPARSFGSRITNFRKRSDSVIQYVRMTQPETWKNLGPPYVMLDQSNYRATISGNLPDGVFNFLWHVVENPNSKTANITLPKRSHT